MSLRMLGRPDVRRLNKLRQARLGDLAGAEIRDSEGAEVIILGTGQLVTPTMVLDGIGVDEAERDQTVKGSRG